MKFETKDQKSPAVDIREYLYLIKKHIWLIIFCFMVTVSGAALWYAKQKKVWRAVSKIQVASGMRLPVPDVYSETAGSYINGQIQIVNSKTLKDRVKERVLKEGWSKKLGDGEVGPKIEVHPVGATDILEMNIDSTNRQYALFYSKVLIDEFIRFKAEKKETSAESALRELAVQTSTLEEQIKSLEEKALNYQKSHDMVAFDEVGNIPATNLAQLQYALAQLRNQRDTVKAQLEKLEGKTDPYLIESSLARLNVPAPFVPLAQTSAQAADTLSDDDRETNAHLPVPVSVLTYFLSADELKGYHDLKMRREQLQDELIRSSKIYKEGHPKIQGLRGQLHTASRQITDEIDNLKRKLKARYAALELEEETKKRSMEEWKKETLALNSQIAEYKNIKAELDRKRKLYGVFVQRIHEIDLAASLDREKVQIVEEPYLLPDPVAPKIPKGMMAAAVLGFGLGIGMAFTLEYINDTVRGEEDLKKVADFPLLALIPKFSSYQDKEPEEKVLKPAEAPDQILETFRRLRTNIVLASPASRLSILLITSAIPGEGKTQTAVNLSVSFALSGVKTLLMDCDLRRGQVHAYFGQKRERGCSTYLSGQASLSAVIQPSGMKDLDILPCGVYPPNPPELISSEAMKELLAKVSDHYDRIIIDSPPVINVADGSILGVLAQGTIVVIEGGKTSRTLVRRAVETLTNNHIHITGVVINNMDETKHDYYSQYYYHYGYKYNAHK
ncbi:MAG: polysaccharide biosynthesis tyrosine autokinase [bacterium]